MTKQQAAARLTFRQEAVRYLYSLLLLVLIPFALLNFLFRKQKKEHTGEHGRFERFGIVSRPQNKGGYLFHCVSVGEVVAASVLIKRIMADEPNTSVTITTTTATGSARVRAIFGDGVNHFYLPYDVSIAMNSMLKRVAPKMVLITEVELWPNLIHCCWRQSIPVVVINGRMTTRSARRYKKIGLLFTPMLDKVGHVCAQGQRDYDNYLFLGIAPSKLTLTNNIKFDQKAPDTIHKSSFHGIHKDHRPIIIGGSTHEGEEQALLDTVISLKPDFPTLLLILVPRHPERFSSVKKLIENQSLQLVCTSHAPTITSEADVVLVDEMGQLNKAYEIANMAFVGGSLADKGGHNALEPAAHKLPIIMGPYTYNNPVICDSLKQSGALIIVNDQAGLTSQCRTYLQRPEEAIKAGEAGYEVLIANKGAVEATISVMKSF
ncbi:lipid IV(A) 3-deoxy-D-manno-octulosonic acid transferase [Alteromonas sp. C1M14]|uniref:lipid IV(A) 3-deoxy-D-manno-octulosonic acid transferase n=1 Tax=Alteromonas sp. C1M14 TaxID=2841567 RepID=UPI001C0A622F|nr:lipid IV(A) 3-deoxy-D-manno-octulosonic acid transferase [Alteromonas sp. C1M14]MBU2978596.1 lipid IV(A) 3-deoxy-D-manno-octulosonic acid transferase [Alteromonas sp. C1M14]